MDYFANGIIQNAGLSGSILLSPEELISLPVNKIAFSVKWSLFIDFNSVAKKVVRFIFRKISESFYCSLPFVWFIITKNNWENLYVANFV